MEIAQKREGQRWVSERATHELRMLRRVSEVAIRTSPNRMEKLPESPHRERPIGYFRDGQGGTVSGQLVVVGTRTIRFLRCMSPIILAQGQPGARNQTVVAHPGESGDIDTQIQLIEETHCEIRMP